ncbi:MAG: HAMP domain-containing sensor histidine kinase [Chitinophagaceae bacterium]
MNKLLNQSLKKFIVYAGIVLVCSIPAYYIIINRLWQYELDEHDIIITTEAAREDSFLIILAVTSLTTLFFILLMTGLILINRRISKRLWQPFYNSLEKIRHFSLDQQQKIEFEKTDIEEFAELNQSIDKLIVGNIAVYNQQKEFADNASHELQTPLAIVQSKLDLLLQSSSLTDEQYNIIEDANKALARVSRINKNLLMLTKIENSQFMEKELVNFSDLLQYMLSLFAHFAEEKQLKIETSILPGVMLEGNKILIDIVVTNLLTNAIRHAPVAGTISIELTETALSISNTGTGSLNHDKLFKRFGTISSNTPGTGLGLALVKQICIRYKWQVSYRFEKSTHTFLMLF